MSSVRFCFTREEGVKFISHLDLMKTFDRAIRRAGLPIVFSKGFNPHPSMVFALPLAVGVTSEAEYADMELSCTISTDEFTERLSAELPSGFTIIKTKVNKSKENIMASINRARYILDLECDHDNSIKPVIDKILTSQSIDMLKKTKSGQRNVNIRPMIHEIQIIKDILKPNKDFTLEIVVSAGGQENLRPDLFVEMFELQAGLKIQTVGTHRKGLYISRNNILLDPLDDIIMGTI